MSTEELLTKRREYSKANYYEGNNI